MRQLQLERGLQVLRLPASNGLCKRVHGQWGSLKGTGHALGVYQLIVCEDHQANALADARHLCAFLLLILLHAAPIETMSCSCGA